MESLGAGMLSPDHWYRQKSDWSSGLMEICQFSIQEGLGRQSRMVENGPTENIRAECYSLGLQTAQ